jgi:hypothetical protein
MRLNSHTTIVHLCPKSSILISPLTVLKCLRPSRAVPVLPPKSLAHSINIPQPNFSLTKLAQREQTHPFHIVKLRFRVIPVLKHHFTQIRELVAKRKHVHIRVWNRQKLQS